MSDLDAVRAELEKTLREIDAFCQSGLAEPRQAGDIYFRVVASGTKTLDAWLEVWGYIV